MGMLKGAGPVLAPGHAAHSSWPPAPLAASPASSCLIPGVLSAVASPRAACLALAASCGWQAAEQPENVCVILPGPCVLHGCHWSVAARGLSVSPSSRRALSSCGTASGGHRGRGRVFHPGSLMPPPLAGSVRGPLPQALGLSTLPRVDVLSGGPDLFLAAGSFPWQFLHKDVLCSSRDPAFRRWPGGTFPGPLSWHRLSSPLAYSVAVDLSVVWEGRSVEWGSGRRWLCASTTGRLWIRPSVAGGLGSSALGSEWPPSPLAHVQLPKS